MFQLFQTLLLAVFPALVIIAGLRDAVSFTIPNWISIALAAAFFPVALVMGASLEQLGLAALVGFGALLVAMGMFAAGWIGGGDAKLFAASGLWLGWSAALPFVLITGLAGGALAVGLLMLRSVWLRPIVAAGPAWMVRLATPDEGAPYGIAIAVGALIAFPHSLLPVLAGAAH
ncbi:A24 family peptidase [Caulobacter mirabilis]|uniref:Pilus assembly protein CpaA n=1 Tax=Caulobacter mirabilis TaxID=69666 RepID=A0A2D2ASF9_9CAUL|nr:prepilin peptidase [Caulobacter mirabilis]ATQ40939.1 pilus assembly protein CpaA [Caulobacter mirabilis]